MSRTTRCSDCESFENDISRRDFVRTAGVTAAAVSLGSLPVSAVEPSPQPELLAARLFQSLNDEQRQKICFAWDHKDDRGLLRTHVSNNWSIIPAPEGQRNPHPFGVGSSFFTNDQRDMIEALFFGMYNPEWHDRIRKQLQDDAGGYGRQQTIAFFGEPGLGKWEFVMTGRHLTIRCDSDSAEHVAFGGPIFYGHAAQGFNEKADHPGNVYWPQALKANKLYQMLDGKQREIALLKQMPYEDQVGFQGSAGRFPGIPIAELSSDQKEHAQGVLQALIEPYRISAQSEVVTCLEAQGGLDACSLAFYQQGDIGEDEVWDVWRIEGPSFVWHFRGEPHVHVWVNIADDPSPKLNAIG